MPDSSILLELCNILDVTINELLSGERIEMNNDKERKAYFDAKTKIHLLNYIESRTDNNITLFVLLNKPHSRLTESFLITVCDFLGSQSSRLPAFSVGE